MKVKKLVLFGAAAGLVCAAIAGKFVHEISQHNVAFLLSCVDIEAAPVAWTCRKVLEHKLNQPETIAGLNASGAALYPVLLSNEVTGREMLQLLVRHGVDVNATETGLQARWTALHIMATDTHFWSVEALLEAGADPMARDWEGMTPLDRARKVQTKYPDPERARIIALLETKGAR